MAGLKRKYVTVRYSGKIPELGGIQGPILNPVWLSLTVIRELIINKRNVYEHDEKNPKLSCLLNLKNYNLLGNITDNPHPDPWQPGLFQIALDDVPSNWELAEYDILYIDIE